MIREAILSDPGLGVDLDRVVARRVGASRAYVAQVRLGRGHSREDVAPRLDPSAHPVARAAIGRSSLQRRVLADPDLGIVPDQTLAERYGCSRRVVWRCRCRSGLEHATQHGHVIDRQRALEAWLREAPRSSADARSRYADAGLIVEVMHRDMAAIGAAYVRGIDRWSLGREDAPIARTDRQRAIAADPELGLVPDRVLAERHATSTSVVQRIRQRAGLRNGRTEDRDDLRAELRGWLSRQRRTPAEVDQWAATHHRTLRYARVMLRAVGGRYRPELDLWEIP